MKNIIFYFSGTGNTYWAAKKMAELIGDYELINIAKFDYSEKIKADRVGIFYPVYYWGIPNIIKKFAQNADIETPYLFELHTMGGYDGVAVEQLSKCLEEKGNTLKGSYRIKMPNSIALLSKCNLATDVYRIPEEKSIERLFTAAEKKIKEYAVEIMRNCPRKHFDPFFAWHGYGKKLNEEQGATYYRKGEEYAANLDNSCIGCGKCSEVCPVGNIRMIDNKPTWGTECEFCIACLHACPNKAINIAYSAGKKRYSVPKKYLEDSMLG